MHELSMADAMVKTVIEVAEKNDAQEITEVSIELGEMTLLNPEQLKFMLEVLSEDTLLEGAEIIIDTIPIEIKCHGCGYSGKTPSDDLDHYAPILNCPECESMELEIISGRECNVKSIKIEKSDEDA
ncbi:MAG: hydrogenase maturation nickel metallochaperone HypA [Methanobacteriaceae archaeon]|jgi:hydrogenase nickel incorporation protein HypA/HybF|nr:MAG: hydrogenase maturation nickel metallochaperone HypA [Methanobacterium sp. BRmetb2]MCC7557618.1 hydrogenase maturation nickel metallochaperone HypA [Methanobacteriaceae archaeon]